MEVDEVVVAVVDTVDVDPDENAAAAAAAAAGGVPPLSQCQDASDLWCAMLNDRRGGRKAYCCCYDCGCCCCTVAVCGRDDFWGAGAGAGVRVHWCCYGVAPYSFSAAAQMSPVPPRCRSWW